MNKRGVEKAIFSIILALMVFSIIFFSFPKPLKAQTTMICGVWYEPLPITAHDFVYESNCCIVIDP